MKSYYLVLNLLPSLVGDLGDVVLAEGASSIDEEPFVDAGTVEMVFAGEFPQLHPIIIGREADAALLHVTNIPCRVRRLGSLLLLRIG